MIIQKDSQFIFNPFSGVTARDVDQIIVPQLKIAHITELISKDQPVLIQFLGKQGRGKTTHLQWLANQMPEYPLYLLRANSSIQKILDDKSDILLIDSIHHVPFLKRVALFKSKKSIIFTTHWTRKIESILSNKDLHTFHFNKISSNTLKTIVQKRMDLVSIDNHKSKISDKEIEVLIDKYQDNYRGIINQLYDKYQL